mmetsp:Transcript_34963/g.84432  ORF Transcript_34963/g.84432 Transcript_34963/m.84432 type:complete len:85 (-) Transcript_34963:247-501(-)
MAMRTVGSHDTCDADREEDLCHSFHPNFRLVGKHAQITGKILLDSFLAALETDGPTKHDEEHDDWKTHGEVGNTTCPPNSESDA